MLPASSKVYLNLLLQSLVQAQTGPLLVHVLVFSNRPNDDQNDKKHSLPRCLIISTSAWSLILDRPPGLKENLLLVNHTHVYPIILYNEVTDWDIFTVIISWIDILSLLFGDFSVNSCGTNKIATQEMWHTNMSWKTLQNTYVVYRCNCTVAKCYKHSLTTASS